MPQGPEAVPAPPNGSRMLPVKDVKHVLPQGDDATFDILKVLEDGNKLEQLQGQLIQAILTTAYAQHGVNKTELHRSVSRSVELLGIGRGIASQIHDEIQSYCKAWEALHMFIDAREMRSAPGVVPVLIDKAVGQWQEQLADRSKSLDLLGVCVIEVYKDEDIVDEYHKTVRRTYCDNIADAWKIDSVLSPAFQWSVGGRSFTHPAEIVARVPKSEIGKE